MTVVGLVVLVMRRGEKQRDCFLGRPRHTHNNNNNNNNVQLVCAHGSALFLSVCRLEREQQDTPLSITIATRCLRVRVSLANCQLFCQLHTVQIKLFLVLDDNDTLKEVRRSSRLQPRQKKKNYSEVDISVELGIDLVNDLAKEILQQELVTVHGCRFCESGIATKAEKEKLLRSRYFCRAWDRPCKRSCKGNTPTRARDCSRLPTSVSGRGTTLWRCGQQQTTSLSLRAIF